jgi:hypothetical protein
LLARPDVIASMMSLRNMGLSGGGCADPSSRWVHGDVTAQPEPASAGPYGVLRDAVTFGDRQRLTGARDPLC